MQNRAPTDNQFGQERLRTQAQPVFTTEQQPGARYEGLAKVFAQGELLAQQAQATKDHTDRGRAQQYANSMTVAELGKKVRNQELMASDSPVFAATLQNIWGVTQPQPLSGTFYPRSAQGR